MPLPGVTASVRPIGLTSRQPPAIQIKDSFGIVDGSIFKNLLSESLGEFCSTNVTNFTNSTNFADSTGFIGFDKFNILRGV